MTAQRVQMLSTEFQPMKETLLVQPVEMPTEKITESGLVIALKPVSVVDVSTLGKVIALGSDINDLAEGNDVLWPNTDGIEFEFIDGKFRLLRYASIIGKKK